MRSCLARARALNFLAFSPTCTEKLAAYANYPSPYSVRFLENVCVNFFNQFVFFVCVSRFFDMRNLCFQLAGLAQHAHEFHKLAEAEQFLFEVRRKKGYLRWCLFVLSA